MKRGTKITLIIAAIVVAILLVVGLGFFSYIVGTYNSLVKKDG